MAGAGQFVESRLIATRCHDPVSEGGETFYQSATEKPGRPGNEDGVAGAHNCSARPPKEIPAEVPSISSFWPFSMRPSLRAR